LLAQRLVSGILQITSHSSINCSSWSYYFFSTTTVSIGNNKVWWWSSFLQVLQLVIRQSYIIHNYQCYLPTTTGKKAGARFFHLYTPFFLQQVGIRRFHSFSDFFLRKTRRSKMAFMAENNDQKFAFTLHILYRPQVHTN